MNICYSPPGIWVAVHENRALHQLFFLSLFIQLLAWRKAVSMKLTWTKVRNNKQWYTYWVTYPNKNNRTTMEECKVNHKITVYTQLLIRSGFKIATLLICGCDSSGNEETFQSITSTESLGIITSFHRSFQFHLLSISAIKIKVKLYLFSEAQFIIREYNNFLL